MCRVQIKQLKLARKSYLLLSFTRHLIPRLNFSTSAESSILLTKKAGIDLLKACRCMSHFLQIHAQLFSHGLHHSIDVLHKLVAFAAGANPAYAEKIFSKIERPTLFIYNVLIKAFAKSGSSRKALILFDELRVRGLWPDNYTYPFLFKAVEGLRLVVEGEKIHGFALKSGMLYDSYVCNSVLNMYGELSCIGSLCKLSGEMPIRDLVSWNVLISGFVKSNKFEQAVVVYRRMRLETSMSPDEATVVSTLTACAALKNVDLGRDIHEYVTNQLGFTKIIRNALLDMYAKCGRLDIARGIFDAIQEKNIVCWTSIVSAYANLGNLEEARVLFERSPSRDLVLWTTMINGYVQFNRVDEAMTLFRHMLKDRVKPDKYTLVALLTGCAQLGALEQGQWIHDFLDENRIPIDAVVGTALINMYAKCGCLEKSLQIFYQFNQKDTASWTSIIFALSMNGDTSRALKLFSEMIRFGLMPDDITFIGVLSACSHGGLVEEGRRHFDSMTKTYQIEPKLEHYGCLIDLLGRAGLLEEALNVIDNVPNKDDKMIIPLYGALLSACRNYEDVLLGECVAKRLAEMESSDSCSQTVLANIYATSSRWEDMIKVRRKMTTLGNKKLPGRSALQFDVNTQ